MKLLSEFFSDDRVRAAKVYVDLKTEQVGVIYLEQDNIIHVELENFTVDQAEHHAEDYVMGEFSFK